MTRSRIITKEHDNIQGDAILLNTICRQASLMDLSGVNSLSDPGFIFCGGKSISQLDIFCIGNNMLFHEANVVFFPVEFSDCHALCFPFFFLLIWAALVGLGAKGLSVESFLSYGWSVWTGEGPGLPPRDSPLCHLL